MTAIELRGVTKRFGSVTALRDLDLTVREGEIYGFLGPNGAGKSTTIDVLLDFVRPDAGRVEVFGRDVRADPVAVRRRVGILPDGFETYDRLTGRQHVAFAVESKSATDDPMAVLDRVGLADDADRPAGGYSKGMTQRLVLGMALVGNPDLLILDEPSTGLDPGGAREMRTIIREERDRGATVFFSSHVLEQVDAVCDRVGILREGELVAEDSVAGLRRAAGSQSALSVAVADATEDALDAVRAVEGVSGVVRDGEDVVVTCEAAAKFPALTALDDAGATIRDVTTTERSLEDLFIQYTDDDRAEVAP